MIQNVGHLDQGFFSQPVGVKRVNDIRLPDLADSTVMEDASVELGAAHVRIYELASEFLPTLVVATLVRSGTNRGILFKDDHLHCSP